MSSIRDRSGRFSKMPDNDSTETPKPRPPADSMANRIEQTRADRAVGELQADGIDARSGARQAYDLADLGMSTPRENTATSELEQMQAQRDADVRRMAEWLQADPIGTPTPVTTTIHVDGRVVHGAPVDPTAQAAFVEQIRAERVKADEAIAAIEAENEGKWRCPI